jgi:hypothetical protein
MRTPFAAVIPGLVLAVLAAPAPALPDMTPVFAVCTGRLSAFVEHEWLMQRDPTRAEADYAAMADVLAAVTDPALASEVMGWRITAKAALRALLARADLQGDLAAAPRAAALIGECRRLIGAPQA